ncbi:MAG: DNA topoisomerase, partial [Saezia sp.]
DYWEVYADFDAQAGTYMGKWFDPEWKKSDDAHLKVDRIWDQAKAHEIVQAVKGQQGIATEESKPSSQLSPLLFDLTSLQREANGRFGFSAKTTLSIAQALYEKHKALTYPRTDSRALPEDYVGEVQATMRALGGSGLGYAPFAQQAIAKNYVTQTKRVFDNKKISDHFAIIPTQQMPQGLSEVEQKIYDLVVRRFMAVFFPAAKYQITTRITKVQKHAFKSEGKVMVEAGWLAIYGKDAHLEDEEGKSLVAIKPSESVQTSEVVVKDEKTKPPARYNEASLLTAMEGAGKTIEDEELRAAMQEKGLGTPATRASIIEGLINEKYLIREGRELVPTAKAFQLLTLLRGLEIKELSKPELTGEWEYKLSQIEKGQLKREQFMAEIAQMTKHMVNKAKEYDRDSVPGDYATLQTPCPNCGGVVKENYRRFSCVGKKGAVEGCGFSISKIPGGRSFELEEAEQLLRDKHIGPLDGFRSKAGWPFAAELKLVKDEEINNWKLEFDFGEKKAEEGEQVDLSSAVSLGVCPQCGSKVFDTEGQYVCEKAVVTATNETPTCKFKLGKTILQQVIDTKQMGKLLQDGKTDLLEDFVSNRTRRKFKAYLTWDKKAEKIAFEFEPRAGKTGARKTAAKKTAAKSASAKKPAAKKAAVAK